MQFRPFAPTERGGRYQPRNPVSRVTVAYAPAQKRYNGKRARRAAYYHRRRCARVLERVMRALGPAYNERMSGAWRDALVYGTGWFMIGPDTPFERTYHGTDEQGRVRVVDTYRVTP